MPRINLRATRTLACTQQSFQLKRVVLLASIVGPSQFEFTRHGGECIPRLATESAVSGSITKVLACFAARIQILNWQVETLQSLSISASPSPFWLLLCACSIACARIWRQLISSYDTSKTCSVPHDTAARKARAL